MISCAPRFEREFYTVTTLREALDAAGRHQAAGRLAEAAALYRRLLRAAPDHPGLDAALTQVTLAIALIQALEKPPEPGGDYVCDLGTLLFEEGFVLRVPRDILPWTQRYKNNLVARAVQSAAHVLGRNTGGGQVFPLYFAEFVYADYVGVRDHLPLTAANVLDIGCGFAGLDLMLFHHYRRDPGLAFHLVEKETMESTEFTVPEPGDPATLRVLETAPRFLAANGVDRAAIHPIPAARAAALRGIRFDLVISIRSWGFIYPLATYMELVQATIKPGGVVIVDVHKDQGGVGALRAHFPAARAIGGTRILERCMAVAD